MDNPCHMVDEKMVWGRNGRRKIMARSIKTSFTANGGGRGGGRGFPMASMRLALTLIGIFIPRNLTTLTALTSALNAANHIVKVKKYGGAV